MQSEALTFLASNGHWNVECYRSESIAWNQEGFAASEVCEMECVDLGGK